MILGLATLPGKFELNSNDIGIYRFENTAYSTIKIYSGNHICWSVKTPCYSAVVGQMILCFVNCPFLFSCISEKCMDFLPFRIWSQLFAGRFLQLVAVTYLHRKRRFAFCVFFCQTAVALFRVCCSGYLHVSCAVWSRYLFSLASVCVSVCVSVHAETENLLIRNWCNLL